MSTSKKTFLHDLFGIPFREDGVPPSPELQRLTAETDQLYREGVARQERIAEIEKEIIDGFDDYFKREFPKLMNESIRQHEESNGRSPE